MKPDEFEAFMRGHGFDLIVEDDPSDDGPSIALWYKYCHEPNCPNPWQQLRMGRDDMYDPAVCALIARRVADGDCGH